MLAALFGNHRGARTISFALVAGLVAFEAVLAFGASAVGIPGIFLVHFTSAEAETGGESVIAKSQKIETMPKSAQAPVQPSLPAPAVTDSPVLTDIAALTSLPDDTQTQIPAERIPDPPAPAPAQVASIGGVSPSYIARPGEREELPWHLTEPMPYQPPFTGRKPAVAAKLGPPVQLPKSGTVEAWVKAKASARADGFELWVEPPAAFKTRLIAVAYESGAKSAEPRVQDSREPSTGFRVRFTGSACADQITLTLKFDDGQTRKVTVDGCKLSG
jgi:hypothetical protein